MTERKLCPKHKRSASRCPACKEKNRYAPITPDMLGFATNQGIPFTLSPARSRCDGDVG